MFRPTRRSGMQIGRFPFNGNAKGSSAQRILPIRRLRRRTPRPGATDQNHQPNNRSQQKSDNKKQPATLHDLRSEHYLAFGIKDLSARSAAPLHLKFRRTFIYGLGDRDLPDRHCAAFWASLRLQVPDFGPLILGLSFRRHCHLLLLNARKHQQPRETFSLLRGITALSLKWFRSARLKTRLAACLSNQA